MFFVMSVPMLLNGKALFRLQRRLPAPYQRPAGALHSAFTVFTLAYNAMPFVDTSYEGSIASWRSVGWIGHWTAGAALLLGWALGAGKSRGVEKAKAA